ncbi:FKBP-type peptidyl-prolyl cis-trans isomerase [Maribacter sp. PR1]|uniref:peptidylprolyl isomerase n=1 Tax=Maribacter cobaltidurans TaxID=1178778 RepID=A0ABU7IZW1_9FLAO|nr:MULTISPECIES: FKBP-type peptidyl-prolyl cis-trans isomerase [Maribacter]MDC6391066.1 FKBP-type peptidyl-prolyl cis-trans isomerase [Maribacter sp. PR1]MEE1978458.1 FKBP-type peptidyl-prolyl cis-trans isomerase [Maribacter cobaltidurans]
MKLKYLLGLTIMIASIWSCKKDDDPIGEVVPPRSIIEVAAEDDAEIMEYLSTHFFNYDEFQNPPADFDYKIRFDTIAGDNQEKISILDSGTIPGIEFGMETITVESSSFRVSDEEVADHTLYYLIARQGGSEATPTIGDNVTLRYEGSLLDGTLFDASSNQPVQFNLSGVVRGFGNGVEYLKTGTEQIVNGDGTVSYSDYGIGAIFIPSGLAYFNSPSGSVISAYSPLIFKVDTFTYEKDTDFDGDGIPSILEDLDGDGNLNNDNTDVETERQVFLANYNDTDDDADGIPTIEEINLDSEGKFESVRDSDGDGVPDHLDSDS